MNTLDDLRSTLDSHSGDLGAGTGALDHATRRSQLQRRITVARRRRNAVRGGVGVAVVAAAVAVATLPALRGGDPQREASVAARTTLGQVAPARMEALGLPYEFEMQTATRTGTSVTFEPDSPLEQPPLLTWTTLDDDATVTVTEAETGHLLWSSATGGFDDHVVLDQWDGGPVTVASTEPGVAAVLYDFDPDAPVEGVSKDGVTFRQVESGRELITAAFASGATVLEQHYSVSDRRVSVAVHCSGFSGKELGVRVSLVGEKGPLVSGETCNDARGPAPASSYTLTLGEDQLSGTVRLELTGSVDDEVRLRGTHPDLLLGLALYEPTQDIDFEGLVSSEAIEQSGHLWQLETARRVRTAGAVDVDLDRAEPHLLTGAVAGRFDDTDDLGFALAFEVDGVRIPSGSYTRSSEGVHLGTVLAPLGLESVTLRPGMLPGVTGSQLLVYRLVE